MVATALALASCASGPPQALCVGAPYFPVCLQQCQTTADCSSGLCAVIGTNPSAARVCFGGLMLCEPTTCDNPAQCLDGMTQGKPLPAAGGICGWQAIHCDSGCDSATGSCK
ncbi:MAG TPA: hypothetical protein VF997_14570 [Polyangia bacterium]